MSDLISRADAIEAVRKEYEDAVNIGDNGDAVAYDVERILSALPSAEGGDTEMTVIPEGTGLMKPCPDNGADLISRQDAIESVRKLKIVEDNKNYPDYAYNAGIETAIKTIELMLSADAGEYIKECNTKTHDLVHRDVIKSKLVDCTDFVNWLIEEVMDDEMWELNAVGNGEIICRKLKKLGLLDVKDGYYICPICGAKMTKGGDDK